MKITVLDGDMACRESAFSAYLAELTAALKGNHDLAVFSPADMELKYCTGCWSCWWKTPGRCVHKDRGEEILRSVISSDLVLFASPLSAGFTTSALKKITDRLVPLVHPYAIFIHGETHHRKRYDRYPRMGLVVRPEPDTDPEDREIVETLYDRLAVNFHSRREFTVWTDRTGPEEAAREIGRL